MELRKQRHKPLRYREPDNFNLSPKASLFHKDIPYNLHLRPACFPTLTLDQFSPDETESEEELTPATQVTTPALVFRDRRIIKRQNNRMEDEFGAFVNEGRYDPLAIHLDDELGDREERIFLPALKRIEWADLSEGIQLIIIMEFCRKMHFAHVVSWLEINDDELCAFMDLTERETQRYKDMMRAETCTTQHTHSLGGPAPTNLCFTLSDITKGGRFLRNFRCLEEYSASELKQLVDLEQGNNEQEDGSGGGGEDTTAQQDLNEYDGIPPFEFVSQIIDILPKYRGSITYITDLEWKRGIFWLFYEVMAEHIKAWVEERMKRNWNRQPQNQEQEDLFTVPAKDGESLPSLGTWVEVHKVVRPLMSRKRSISASNSSAPSEILPTAGAAPQTLAPSTATEIEQEPSPAPPRKKVKKNGPAHQTPQTPAQPPMGLKQKQGPSTKETIQRIRDKKAMTAPSRLRQVTNAEEDMLSESAIRSLGIPSRAISPAAASADMRNDVTTTRDGQRLYGVGGHGQYLPQTQDSLHRASSMFPPVVETPSYVSPYAAPRLSAMPSSQAPQNPLSFGDGQFTRTKQQHSLPSTLLSQAPLSQEEDPMRPQLDMNAAKSGSPAPQVQAMTDQERKQAEKEAVKYNMTISQYIKELDLIKKGAAKHNMSVSQYQEMRKQKYFAAEAAKHKISVQQYLELRKQNLIAEKAAKYNMSVPQYMKQLERLKNEAAKHNMTVSQYQEMRKQKYFAAEAAKHNMSISQYQDLKQKSMEASNRTSSSEFHQMQTQESTMAEGAKHNIAIPGFQDSQKQLSIAAEELKHNMSVAGFQDLQKQQSIAAEAAKLNMSVPQFEEMRKRDQEQGTAKPREIKKQNWLTEEAAKLNMTVPQFQELQRRNQELEAARLGMTVPQYQTLQREIATGAAKRNMTVTAYLAALKHTDINQIKARMTGPQFEQMVNNIKGLASQRKMTETQYLASQKHTEICAAKHGLNPSQFWALRRQIETEARAKAMTTVECLAKMQTAIQQAREQRSPQQQKKRPMSTEDEGEEDIPEVKRQRVEQ